MSELPNNSEKALSSTRPPEKRNAVVTREVKHRQSLGKMLRDSFIPEDVEHAGDYILKDMIVPGLRDGVFDILMGILDYWRGGVGGGYRRSFGGYSNGPRIHQQTNKDYNRVSRIGVRNDKAYDTNRSVRSYDDIVIPDYPPSEGGMAKAKQEAEDVIAELKDTIRGYGLARVSDLREAINESWTPSEYNYGWTNLDNAGYDRVRGGWLLILPKAMPIDN